MRFFSTRKREKTNPPQPQKSSHVLQVQITGRIKPILLVSPEFTRLDRRTCITTGWGLLNEGAVLQAKVLQEVGFAYSVSFRVRSCYQTIWMFQSPFLFSGGQLITPVFREERNAEYLRSWHESPRFQLCAGDFIPNSATCDVSFGIILCDRSSGTAWNICSGHRQHGY